MERTKASCHAVVDSEGLLVLSARYPRLLLSCRTNHASSHLFFRLAAGSRVSCTLVCSACDADPCLRVFLQLLQLDLQREHRVVAVVGCR